MADMTTPNPPPEATLIETRRKARSPRISIRKAAEASGISDTRWRQIVAGYQIVAKDHRVPVRAPAETLARMAETVGVTSDELVGVGRADAAEALVVRDEPSADESTVTGQLRRAVARLDALTRRLADIPTIELVHVLEQRVAVADRTIASLERSLDAQWAATERYIKEREQDEDQQEPRSQESGQIDGSTSGRRRAPIARAGDAITSVRRPLDNTPPAQAASSEQVEPDHIRARRAWEQAHADGRPMAASRGEKLADAEPEDVVRDEEGPEEGA